MNDTADTKSYAIAILTDVVVGAAVVEFPSTNGAANWCHSDAYQAIVALRADNSNSTILTIEAVPAGHLATDILTAP